MSTPSTDEVRKSYSEGHRHLPYYNGGKEQTGTRAAEFDAWLAAHDAEVRTSVAPTVTAEPDAWACVCGKVDPGLYVRADEPHTVTSEQVEAVAYAIFREHDKSGLVAFDGVPRATSLAAARAALAALGITVEGVQG